MVHQFATPSRFDAKSARRRYIRITVGLTAVLSVLYLFSSSSTSLPLAPPSIWTKSSTPSAAPFSLEDLPPVIPDSTRPGHVVAANGRLSDVTDAFVNYTRYPWCTMSSLELHDPFHPLCPDKPTVLRAMSSGGRSGVDMPYRPKDCDMRWFSTAEICEIMSKFSFVHVIGDSMMRNLAVAMHIFLREDLMDGPWLGWTKTPDDVICSCSKPFDSSKCIFNAAFTSKLIWEKDPESFACPRETSPFVEYNPQTTYPLGDSVNALIGELPKEKPSKPHAFVIGHGVWNGLNETATELFLREVETGINKTMPWVTESGAVHPRLFVTPSASGDNKPVQYQDTQGNVALRRFEMNMGPRVKSWGYDHLGTFNMTLQNTTPDGTHAGMRSNLIKAMMVFNWLYHYDTRGY